MEESIKKADVRTFMFLIEWLDKLFKQVGKDIEIIPFISNRSKGQPSYDPLDPTEFKIGLKVTFWEDRAKFKAKQYGKVVAFPIDLNPQWVIDKIMEIDNSELIEGLPPETIKNYPKEEETNKKEGN